MKKVIKMDQNFHVLMLREDPYYVAHCLEMDICGQGSTHDEAVNDLKNAIKAQIAFCVEKDTPEAIFRPAPKEYWDKFAASIKSNFKKSNPHLDFAYA